MTRKGIMLCYPFEEKRLLKYPKPWIVQPKLDGDRCRAIVRSGICTLLSSEENIIKYTPHINRALEDLNLPDVELDGELYRHGMDFSEIHSIVSRKKNIHDSFLDVEYHVFDVVASGQQADRSIWLRNFQKHLPEDSPIKVVPYKAVMTLEDIFDFEEQMKIEGYEGFIVRNAYASYVRKRSTEIMKFKPRKSDYYEIIGCVEEISIKGEAKGALGAFICKGNDATRFQVGSGQLLTRQNREELWKVRTALTGKLLHVKYQHLTQKDKVPRFPVAVEILDPTIGEIDTGG